MKYQKTLFSVFSITLLSFAGWFAVLQTVDPYTTDWFSKLMFYIFLLVVIAGITCMILFFLKKNKSHKPDALMYSSIRQGLIVAFAIIGLVALRTINVLNVLSASVYILALVLIEFYFRTRNPHMYT